MKIARYLAGLSLVLLAGCASDSARKAQATYLNQQGVIAFEAGQCGDAKKHFARACEINVSLNDLTAACLNLRNLMYLNNVACCNDQDSKNCCKPSAAGWSCATPSSNGKSEDKEIHAAECKESK